MLHKKRSLRFKCTACGKCCYGDKDAYIKLNRKEMENISRHLNITPAHFKRYYLTRLVHDGYGIMIKDSGACSLLDNNGKCRAYDARPMQCRTYPYWPEILINTKTWVNEKKKCEGIELGDVIDNDYIDKQLALSIAADNEIY